jgi:regulator of replication initiation timing
MPAITFQSVDNEYEWGTYFDLKVLIMSRNGYINATKMCQDNGKRLDNWMQNSWSKDYIEDFNSHPYIPGTPSTIVVNSGSNDTRGTYVHLELITHIASWISIKIARKVSRIVNEYLLKEEKIKHALVTKEKDDKIGSLEATLEAILKNTSNLDTKVTDLTDEISKLSLDNQITHEKLNIAQNTLNIVVEDRVVKPNNKGMTNTVIIYEYELNKFRIFRVQKRSANTSVKRYLSMNPNAVRFAEIDYNPNSVNYFIRFKEQLKGNIKWNYNRFELLNITKDQLKEFIMKINEEKYELEETF